MAVSSEELADRVHSLAMQLLRRVRAADFESALSEARLSALSVLVFSGPRTVGELAAADQVTAPTMSRLVTALEREGYVRRETDTDDGRRVRVVATAEGVRALSEARRQRVSRVAGFLEAIDEDDRRTVLEATELLEAALAETEPAAR
ncbi:MAG: MarR family winged helix-turn-helix transcriptional regulator [Candidatus Longimicrobiales bacterium M2_2A_002]